MMINKSFFLHLGGWSVAWYVLLILSTMLTAELVILSSVVLGMVNVLLQERFLLSSFGGKSSRRMKKYFFLGFISLLPIFVYMIAIMSFPAICKVNTIDLLLSSNAELDFCASSNLQSQGIIFLMALAFVTSLLFGIGRMFERKSLLDIRVKP